MPGGQHLLGGVEGAFELADPGIRPDVSAVDRAGGGGRDPAVRSARVRGRRRARRSSAARDRTCSIASTPRSCASRASGTPCCAVSRRSRSSASWTRCVGAFDDRTASGSCRRVDLLAQLERPGAPSAGRRRRTRWPCGGELVELLLRLAELERVVVAAFAEPGVFRPGGVELGAGFTELVERVGRALAGAVLVVSCLLLLSVEGYGSRRRCGRLSGGAPPPPRRRSRASRFAGSWPASHASRPTSQRPGLAGLRVPAKGRSYAVEGRGHLVAITIEFGPDRYRDRRLEIGRNPSPRAGPRVKTSEHRARPEWPSKPRVAGSSPARGTRRQQARVEKPCKLVGSAV